MKVVFLKPVKLGGVFYDKGHTADLDDNGLVKQLLSLSAIKIVEGSLSDDSSVREQGLSSMTISQLRQMARGRGIKSKGLTKKQLIERLMDAEGK